MLALNLTVERVWLHWIDVSHASDSLQSSAGRSLTTHQSVDSCPPAIVVVDISALKGEHLQGYTVLVSSMSIRSLV